MLSELRRLFQLFMLLMPCLTRGALEAPTTDLVELELSKYIRSYKSKRPEEYNSCSYINAHADATKDISRWFIRYNGCPSLIPHIDRQFDVSHYPWKTQGTFVFIETLDELAVAMDTLGGYSFWNPHGENHFIVCTRVVAAERQLLLSTMEYVWSQGVLNYLLVYVNTELEVYSYNPFNKQMYRKDFNSNYDLFHDKTKNMYGTRLKVGLFQDLWLNSKQPDGTWLGTDVDRLNLVTTMLNASYEIVESDPKSNFQGAFKKLLANESDVCFVSCFFNPNSPTVDFSVPHEKNAVVAVIVVPKGGAGSGLRLDSLVTSNVWALYATSILLIAAILWLVNGRLDFTRTLLDMYSSGLGNPSQLFPTESTYIGSYLLVYFYGSIIIRTACQCVLMSYFVSPSSIERIRSISQLQQSKDEIYITDELSKMVPAWYNLKDKYRIITRETRAEMLYKTNQAGAYVTTADQAEVILAKLQEIQFPNHFTYLMDDDLVPSYSSYMFRKRSPYLDKFNEIFLMIRETKVLRSTNIVKVDRAKLKRPEEDHNKVVALTLDDFRFIFSFVAAVYGTSFLVFGVEIMWNKWAKKLTFMRSYLM